MICGFFMDESEQHLLVLIGPMGAGKTTIGKLLAQHFGYDFCDSDHEIEQRTGASVGWIFDKEGESGFRERECRAIEELTQRTNTVVATGGGAVMTPQNHLYLSRGIVIYLRATVDVQFERTCRDKSRPLLRTENPKARLAELFEIRDPIYQQLADITVTTGYISPKRMVQEIIDQLQKRQASIEP